MFVSVCMSVCMCIFMQVHLPLGQWVGEGGHGRPLVQSYLKVIKDEQQVKKKEKEKEGKGREKRKKTEG